jgi:hypothetical protein
MDYEGIVIEESLDDLSVLDSADVLDSRVEPIAATHQTPWLSRWTLLTVRVPEAKAREIADALSRAIDAAHATSWYADFKNETYHYVIYRDRVFFIDRRSPDQYAEAVDYGISRGLPEHQADFVALIDD